METSEGSFLSLSPDRLSRLFTEYQVIINGISDALMLLDANTYKVIEANQAFLEVYHLTRDQVVGKTCHKLTHNLDIPCGRVEVEHCCPLEGSLRTGEPFHAEHVHRDSQGRNLFLEMTAYPVKDADGKISRVIHLARDVTLRKEAEIALKESAEKIKRFAYSVAHDLKNPSVAVYGVTKLLLKHYAHSLDEKGRNHCEQILRGAREIAELVENINRYIATKELTLDIENVDLLEILKDLRAEFSAQLGEKQVRWKEPGASAVIEADKASFTRVLRNLVENALKHGGSDLQEIEIAYKSTDDEHVLCVRDDGVALREADTDRIFDFFGRGSNSKNIQGIGLGLAIVREIVEQHGGRVWLETGNVEGTTFCFSLPKAQQ